MVAAVVAGEEAKAIVVAAVEEVQTIVVAVRAGAVEAVVAIEGVVAAVEGVLTTPTAMKIRNDFRHLNCVNRFRLACDGLHLSPTLSPNF